MSTGRVADEEGIASENIDRSKTEINQSAAQVHESGNRTSQSADAFSEFLAAGDMAEPEPVPGTSGHINDAGTQNRRGSSSSVASNPSPGAFLSGIFQKVSSSFETTLEHAKREIGRNEMLTHAHENISGLAGSIQGVTSGQNNGTAGIGTESFASHVHRDKTISLKMLRLSTVPSSPVLLAFINARSRDLIVVTERAIEAFDCIRERKLLESSLRAAHANNSNGISGPSEGNARTSSSSEATKDGSQAALSATLPKPWKATCAAFLPATEEVVVGNTDGVLRLYSVQPGRMGLFIREKFCSPMTPDARPTHPTVLQLLPTRPSRLIAGFQNGSARVFETEELTVVGEIDIPEICLAPSGSDLPNSPVTCLDTISPFDSDLLPHPKTTIHIGYGDGAVSTQGMNDDKQYNVFVAQGGDVTGIICLFGGILCVSIGTELDPSICVTETAGGRCLIRRMLPYSPTKLSRIAGSTKSSHTQGRVCCPSENTFIVGGSEGQVELFRVNVLSTQKIELRLERRVCDRVRGRQRDIQYLFHEVVDRLIIGITSAGEIRRWRLAVGDANAVIPGDADPEDAVTVTADNIVDFLFTDSQTAESRLCSGESIISAQRILATVLEDDVGVDESGKDALVEEFQRHQAEMQEAATMADKEYSRARRRIQGRFARGIRDDAAQNDSSSMCMADRQLQAAARRTAAFELQFAQKRHAEQVTKVKRAAVDRLRTALLNSLRTATGDVEAVQPLRAAAYALKA